jgi:hypothetical protein
MRLVGHIACSDVNINVIIVKHEGRRPIWITAFRWEGNIEKGKH